jgi:hypothetical protein
MTMMQRRAGEWFCAIMICALAVTPAAADAGPGDAAEPFELKTSDHLDGAALAQAEKPEEETMVAERTEVETAKSEEFSFPVGFDVSYGLYSDYIFRFANYSEYAGEGREKPNHQLSTDVTFDLGDFGTIAYGAWFEWYAAQSKLTGSGANIQEIDHWIEWSYTIKPIKTDLAIGYTFYTYPNAKSLNTSEYYISLSHNDAWMWKWLLPDNEEGVLNPSFFMAHDVDQLGGVWMEFGLSHPFELFENFTLTPGWMVAIDACYYDDHHTRFAGDQWSLVAEYDVGALLQLPAWAGSVTVAGELYWNNPWGTFEDTNLFVLDDGTDTVRDQLWGGFSVNWSWGGG